MKLTKYDYKYKDYFKNYRYKIGRRALYARPIERLIFIIVINLAIIALPFGIIFISNVSHKITFSIVMILVVAVHSIALEYNPLMIINFLDYIIFSLFYKDSVYKKFVRELRDYRYIIRLEKKLNIEQLRISCVNSKKIMFNINRKGLKKGIIFLKRIVLILDSGKKIVIDYNIKDFNNLGEYLNFINYHINGTKKMLRG